MLSAFAAPLGLVCPAGRAPPGFLSTRCLVTGCSSGVFLLAVPLGRQSGLCSSSSRSGSLQASGLDRGGGGGTLSASSGSSGFRSWNRLLPALF